MRKLAKPDVTPVIALELKAPREWIDGARIALEARGHEILAERIGRTFLRACEVE